MLFIRLLTFSPQSCTKDAYILSAEGETDFDRNWELLSFIILITLFKAPLKKHLQRKIDDTVFMNLSRLASQWEEIINATLFALQTESVRRLDNLISTIEKLLDIGRQETLHIRKDLETLEALRAQLRK